MSEERQLEPLLLRVEQTAEMLGISPSMCRRLVTGGELPMRQIGSRAVGFLREDVVAFAKSRPLVARLAYRPDDALNQQLDPAVWRAAADRGDELMSEVGFERETEDAG